VDPGAGGVVRGLRRGMGGMPVASRLLPQGLQRRSDPGRRLVVLERVLGRGRGGGARARLAPRRAESRRCSRARDPCRARAGRRRRSPRTGDCRGTVVSRRRLAPSRRCPAPRSLRPPDTRAAGPIPRRIDPPIERQGILCHSRHGRVLLARLRTISHTEPRLPLLRLVRLCPERA
jgi:hypothetical protein